MSPKRDHGGGLDAAIEQYGGQRSDWLDLSTGINPIPYPIPEIPNHFWQALPDSAGQTAVLNAARTFWKVPKEADIIATSGVSQLIAALPTLASIGSVEIIGPTYNEHAAAFRAGGWTVGETGQTRVIVHPNNPDGKRHHISPNDIAKKDLTIIDESFCDVCPNETLIKLTRLPNVIVLKGLGKFWGLAGLRLGFAIASPELIKNLTDRIGPWAISGPAQLIGKKALSDYKWSDSTRSRLSKDALKLDTILTQHGAKTVGGTDLFRLYEVGNAKTFQAKLAKKFIWSRVFPYSNNWVRLGLPGTDSQWNRLLDALDI